MSKTDPHPGAFTADMEGTSRGQAPLFPKSQTALAGEYPPPPLPGSNRWVEQRLFVKLIEAGLGPEIVVVADEWYVTLTGQVRSEQAVKRAVEIAKLFPGVTGVRSALEVGTNGVAASPDTRMRPALREHPGGLIEPRSLIGQPLLDQENRTLGTVTHVWAEPKSGEIQEVVVKRDGRGHLIVQWDDLEIAWKDQTPVLKLDK